MGTSFSGGMGFARDDEPPRRWTRMKSPETRMTLLLRIRDASDRLAWKEFFELYAPLIYSYAAKHGFQDADASDIAQEVMCTLARTVHRFEYDPKKGAFRGWLVTVTRNCLRKRWERSHRDAVAQGTNHDTSQLTQLPSPETISEWDREYELRLFHWAAEKVKSEFKPSTWDAFWRTTVDGSSIESVASDLQLSAGAVYIARSRVLARIRATIAQIDDWESHP